MATTATPPLSRLMPRSSLSLSCALRTPSSARRAGQPPWRFGWWVVGSLSLLLSSPTIAAPLRVTGTPFVEASATLHEDELVIRGRLDDDRGRPLRGAEIRLRRRGHDGRVPLLTGLSACAGTDTPRDHQGSLLQRTNEAGVFCLIVRPGSANERLEVSYAGDPLHPAVTSQQVPVRGRERSLSLGFSPDPRRLAVDGDDPRVWILAEATPSAASAAPFPVEILLAASDGVPELLTTTRVRLGERTSVLLPVARLGGPGPASLRLRSAGTSELGPAEHRVAIERTARVRLALVTPPVSAGGRSGIPLALAVSSQGGPVTGGAVEVRADDRVVGAAPVSAGSAHPIAILADPPDAGIPLTARYLPDSPWWIPEAPIPIWIPPSVPSPWSRYAWLAAGALVFLLAALARRRPRRPEPRPHSPTRPHPPGRPRLDLVASNSPSTGWLGTVLDAHLGVPIPNAELRLLTGAPPATREVARATTDASGRFQLTPPSACTLGVLLEVRAPWHSTLVDPLPTTGTVTVSLVTRRRGLLDRLVAWIERSSPPWRLGPAEPTPGQLARIARRRGAPEVDAWARAVEAAAFGPDPVDEAREQALLTDEPPEKTSREG